MSWADVGRKLVQQLEGLDNEEAILGIGEKAIAKLCSQVEDPQKRKNALKSISREILKRFPRQETESPLYWHDDGGKSDLPKWRHLIFKTLTLPRDDEEKTEVTESTEVKAVEEVETTTSEEMNLKSLGLDSETQTLVESAIASSGKSPNEFICQALTVYAKTVLGKLKISDSDNLAAITTERLFNDSSLSTLPGRAGELTRRAIQAIKVYNSEYATEKSQRWAITQSAIAKLTGSAPRGIKETLALYETDIKEHNDKYELDGYSNRKSGTDITEAIDLVKLVPDGF